MLLFVVAGGVQRGIEITTTSAVEQPVIPSDSSSGHDLVAAPASTTQSAANSSAPSHADSSSAAMSSETTADHCGPAHSSMRVRSFYGRSSVSHKLVSVKPSRYVNAL